MEVHVIHLDTTNVRQLFHRVLAAVQNAAFVSVDLEMTGLGDRAAAIDAKFTRRYAALRAAAETRALLSMGVSCFISDGEGGYRVHVFDILLRSEREHVVEPQSVQFLLQHAFDFNKQLALGLPYCPYAGASLVRPAAPEHDWMKQLVDAIVVHKRKLVVHNGFLDLLFLYQHFWAPLPEDFATFVCDLAELFECVYDTKLLGNHDHNVSKTGLEDLFRHYCHRGTPVNILAPSYAILMRNLPSVSTVEVDRQQKEQSDAKRVKIEQGRRSDGHRAGFDSFMTGYIFAVLSKQMSADKLSTFKNKIAMSAKSRNPLSIMKSSYSKASANHQSRMVLLNVV